MLSESEIYKRLSHRPEISIDYHTFKNVNERCRFIDRDYGDFSSSLNNVFRGGKHPDRKRKYKEKNKDYPDFIQKSLDGRLSYKKLKIIPESFRGMDKNADFIDMDYGPCNLKIWSVLYHNKVHPNRYIKKRIIRKLTCIKYIKNKINEIHGEKIKIMEETYKGVKKKAKFIHYKYGEFESLVYSILSGHSHKKEGSNKKRDTCMKRYGVKNPTMRRDFWLKAAISSNRSVIINHWKTNQQIVCTGSYEYGVFTKLNRLRIDYTAQIPFELEIDGDKRVYFVDLYIPEKQIYIEIKGIFRNSLGFKKWEKFHLLHPNSELWGKAEIEKFCEKTSYRISKDFKTAHNLTIKL